MFLEEAAALRLRRTLDVADEPGPRFPDWPFGSRRGYVTMFEFDRVLGPGFGAVLQSLVQHYGDDHAGLVALQPGTAYFANEYGFSPTAMLPSLFVNAEYGEAIDFAPGGDITGSLRVGVSVFVIAGSSHQWAVHAQRDWEMGVLITADADGPWRRTDVPWYPRADATKLRGPVGWSAPQTAAEMRALEENLRNGSLD